MNSGEFFFLWKRLERRKNFQEDFGLKVTNSDEKIATKMAVE